MSYSADKLLKLATEFQTKAEDIVKNAKVDPKAKIVFPANKSKDQKDHFPINDAAQARKALTQSNQLKAAPDWYSGSLQSLVSTVAKTVKKHYPEIEIKK